MLRAASAGREAEADSGEDRFRLWPPPKGIGLALAALGLIFAGHLAYGALLAAPALLGAAASAALLLVCLVLPALRQDLLRIRGLVAPGGLFLLVLLLGALSLTPYAPGGPHPVWAFVGVAPGAATIDRSATVLELAKLMGLACLFLVGVATGASDERARTAVKLFVVAAAAYGAFAFISYVSSGAHDNRTGRLEATLMSPNTAGTFFAVATVVLLGPLLRKIRGRSASRALQAAPAYWAALLVLMACLLMTASRGAALAAACGVSALLVLLALAGRVKWTRASLALLGGTIALIFAVAVFGETLALRFVRVEEDALSRADLFRLHWNAFLASPWSGYGLGTFDIVHRTLLDSTSVESLWRIRATHNVYLQWLEEGGVLMAAAMFGALGVILLTTVRRGLRRSRMTQILFALIASNLVFMVHGLSDFALQTPSMAMMWSYLLGLQFALSQGSRR